jgi:hypothetical protein
MNAPAHVNQAIRIGCIRFKHGRIRWHTAMKAQTFLSMLKISCAFGRMVYTISIL